MHKCTLHICLHVELNTLSKNTNMLLRHTITVILWLSTFIAVSSLDFASKIYAKSCTNPLGNDIAILCNGIGNSHCNENHYIIIIIIIILNSFIIINSQLYILYHHSPIRTISLQCTSLQKIILQMTIFNF